MIIRCIDFETTGFPPKAGVCEIGWTDVQPRENEPATIYPTTSFLCNPGMPIGIQAMAIHGITEDDVADAPSALTMFAKAMENVDVFCAHNAEFEQQFFGGGERPWICTYKVALVQYPDLKTHKNGSLPEQLGIDLDAARCAPLHRAGPDTYVTAMILKRFLADGVSVDAMVAITRAPRRVTRMPFGKYAGTKISDLPRDYMAWAVRNLSSPDIVAAIRSELSKPEGSF